jgi:hypothetical protein
MRERLWCGRRTEAWCVLTAVFLAAVDAADGYVVEKLVEGRNGVESKGKRRKCARSGFRSL